MKKNIIIIIGLLILVTLAGAGWGNIVEKINFQGKLLKDGNPDTAPKFIWFGIFDDPTGGSRLWYNYYRVTPESSGIFNVNLEGGGLENLAFDIPYYVKIVPDTTGDDPAKALSPRQPLTAFPYAFNARSVIGHGKIAVTRTDGVTPVAGQSSLGTGVYGKGGNAGASFESTNGYGLKATSTSEVGIYGFSSASNGGYFENTSAAGYGVAARSTSGIGVYGRGAATAAAGGDFKSSTAGKYAVSGIHTGGSGNCTGVYGKGDPGGSFEGTATGGYGINSKGYIGAAGYSTNSGTFGLLGYRYDTASLKDYRGAYGQADQDTFGCLGYYYKYLTNATIEAGAYGRDNKPETKSASIIRAGVYGKSGGNYGVYGYSSVGNGIDAHSVNGIAVYAKSTSDYGIHAQTTSTDEYAALFKNNNGSTYKGLGVRGYIRASGTIETRAFDLAEWIKTSDPAVSAGDVVVIDPAAAESVKKSDAPGSVLLAGVISTDPGLLLGYHEKGSSDPIGATDREMEERGFRRLALAGRVPCRVSAENGPIEPGDLLVTSSTPGHAMKAPANPKVGSVLGKALGPLTSGRGTITVLVMLQ